MHQEHSREVQDRGVASRAFVPLVFVGILCGMFVAGRGDAASADRGRPGESAVKVGEAAPDVELVRLESVKPEGGGKTGAEEKIKLSSYRGTKPVVLVFASYT